MRPVRLALAGLLLLGLGGCGASQAGGSTPASSPASRAVTTEDLDGGSYTSTQVSGHDLVAGTKVRLSFEDGGMVANAGCNTMSGELAVHDGRLAWTGEPVSTLMGCDESRSAQDHWLGGLLTSGMSATGGGGALTLTAGAVTIELVRATPTGAASLLGTRWTVTGFGDAGTAQSVATGAPRATLDLGSDGAVTFDTGCNTGRSRATASGVTLTFEPAALTRKACPDPQSQALESAVVHVLDGAVEVSVEGTGATFVRGDRLLTLTRR